jgi:hypothetical protein
LESLSLVPAPDSLELPASALEVSALPFRRILRYGLFAAVSAAAALLAVQTLSPSKKSEPRFIVVQKDPRANELQREEREHTSSAPAVSQLDAVTTPESAPPAKRTSAPADAAEALAQSFRAQRASVVRCVNTYPHEVEQSPKLSLRISLNAQGAVNDAQLSPAQLAGTPLSACIEGAARALRFPKQVGPVVFDVPLTARKGS